MRVRAEGPRTTLGRPPKPGWPPGAGAVGLALGELTPPAGAHHPGSAPAGTPAVSTNSVPRPRTNTPVVFIAVRLSSVAKKGSAATGSRHRPGRGLAQNFDLRPPAAGTRMEALPVARERPSLAAGSARRTASGSQSALSLSSPAPARIPQCAAGRRRPRAPRRNSAARAARFPGPAGRDRPGPGRCRTRCRAEAREP